MFYFVRIFGLGEGKVCVGGVGLGGVFICICVLDFDVDLWYLKGGVG